MYISMYTNIVNSLSLSHYSHTARCRHEHFNGQSWHGESSRSAPLHTNRRTKIILKHDSESSESPHSIESVPMIGAHPEDSKGQSQ